MGPLGPLTRGKTAPVAPPLSAALVSVTEVKYF